MPPNNKNPIFHNCFYNKLQKQLYNNPTVQISLFKILGFYKNHLNLDREI